MNKLKYFICSVLVLAVCLNIASAPAAYASDAGVTVYLVTEKDVKINDAYGTEFSDKFLANAFKITAAQGSALPIPSGRTGFTFRGYFEGKDGKLAEHKTVPSSETILYALWNTTAKIASDDYLPAEKDPYLSDMYLGEVTEDNQMRWQASGSGKEYYITKTFAAGDTFRMLSAVDGSLDKIPYAAVMGAGFKLASAGTDGTGNVTANYIGVTGTEGVDWTKSGTNASGYSYNIKTDNWNFVVLTAGTYTFYIQTFYSGLNINWLNFYCEPA